jgi:hypothetical protein
MVAYSTNVKIGSSGCTKDEPDSRTASSHEGYGTALRFDGKATLTADESGSRIMSGLLKLMQILVADHTTTTQKRKTSSRRSERLEGLSYLISGRITTTTRRTSSNDMILMIM